MINIEKAKNDFEYFYKEVLIFQDKDGNQIPAPYLTDYQKAWLKWIEKLAANGVKAIYLSSPTRYELYR